jgi:hypothetical protein
MNDGGGGEEEKKTKGMGEKRRKAGGWVRQKCPGGDAPFSVFHCLFTFPKRNRPAARAGR